MRPRISRSNSDSVRGARAVVTGRFSSTPRRSRLDCVGAVGGGALGLIPGVAPPARIAPPMRTTSRVLMNLPSGPMKPPFTGRYSPVARAARRSRSCRGVSELPASAPHHCATWPAATVNVTGSAIQNFAAVPPNFEPPPPPTCGAFDAVPPFDAWPPVIP